MVPSLRSVHSCQITGEIFSELRNKPSLSIMLIAYLVMICFNHSFQHIYAPKFILPVLSNSPHHHFWNLPFLSKCVTEAQYFVI